MGVTMSTMGCAVSTPCKVVIYIVWVTFFVVLMSTFPFGIYSAETKCATIESWDGVNSILFAPNLEGMAFYQPFSRPS